MIRAALRALAFAAALAPAGPAPAPAQAQRDAEAVAACFERYKDAYRSLNAEAALLLVTPETVAAEHRLLQAALYADEASVRRLDPIELTAVLATRHLYAGRAAELARLDARGAFAFSVREAGTLQRSEALRRMSLGEIRVAGDAATGRVLNDGRPTPVAIELRRGAACWLADMGGGSLFHATTRAAVAETLARRGVSAESFALQAVAAQSGGAPGPEVWRPLLSR